MKRWLPFVKNDPSVAVIRLSGVIATGSRGALNDAALAGTIEKAFGRGKPSAVALVLNSPGGSPVQSSLIAARIRRLAAEKNIPVYAFVEDVAASGGYWLACAADEIFVDLDKGEFDRNRLSGGFKALLTDCLGADIYYFWQASQKGEYWIDHNVLGVKLKVII